MVAEVQPAPALGHLQPSPQSRCHLRAQSSSPEVPVPVPQAASRPAVQPPSRGWSRVRPADPSLVARPSCRLADQDSSPVGAVSAEVPCFLLPHCFLFPPAPCAVRGVCKHSRPSADLLQGLFSGRVLESAPFLLCWTSHPGGPLLPILWAAEGSGGTRLAAGSRSETRVYTLVKLAIKSRDTVGRGDV